MKFKAKLLVVLVVIVSGGLAACAVTPAAPTPVPPTPSPVPSTPAPVQPTPTPVPPTPSITVEDLIGIWQNPDAHAVQFNEDGTYRQGPAPALETFFSEVGRFQLEGTVITFLTDEGRACGVGQSGSYQVELTEPDLFQLVLQEDACQSRANYYPGTWNRVETTPSITQEDLTGVWYMASLETFFQVNEDGTFSFGNSQQELEEAPFDAGQYRLEGTSLTFISNKESKVCAGQTGSYEVELKEEGQLQFVPQEDPCLLRVAGLRSGLWPRFEP